MDKTETNPTGTERKTFGHETGTGRHRIGFETEPNRIPQSLDKKSIIKRGGNSKKTEPSLPKNTEVVILKRHDHLSSE